MRIVDYIFFYWYNNIILLYYKNIKKGVKMIIVLIMGYFNFDLGVFNEKDIRLKIIKKVICCDLESLVEEGIKWLVFIGNLGFEFWVLDVVNEMKEEYDFSLVMIFDFEMYGDNWNAVN